VTEPPEAAVSAAVAGSAALNPADDEAAQAGPANYSTVELPVPRLITCRGSTLDGTRTL
jgi:hypothetical protein